MLCLWCNGPVLHAARASIPNTLLSCDVYTLLIHHLSVKHNHAPEHTKWTGTCEQGGDRRHACPPPPRPPIHHHLLLMCCRLVFPLCCVSIHHHPPAVCHMCLCRAPPTRDTTCPRTDERRRRSTPEPLQLSQRLFWLLALLHRNTQKKSGYWVWNTKQNIHIHVHTHTQAEHVTSVSLGLLKHTSDLEKGQYEERSLFIQLDFNVIKLRHSYIYKKKLLRLKWCSWVYIWIKYLTFFNYISENKFKLNKAFKKTHNHYIKLTVFDSCTCFGL